MGYSGPPDVVEVPLGRPPKSGSNIFSNTPVRGLKTVFTGGLLVLGLAGMVLAEAPPARPEGWTEYRDPSQGAFTLYLPPGWSATGGMKSSGRPWNLADRGEVNLDLRVSSSSGGSWVQFFPRFYFLDPFKTAASAKPFVPLMEDGIWNGFWLFVPRSPADYTQHIVLDRLLGKTYTGAVVNGEPEDCPGLRRAVPPTAGAAQGACVPVRFGREGRPYQGKVCVLTYTLLDRLWTTGYTWGIFAPRDRWAAESPELDRIARSFRLEPDWIQQAVEKLNRRFSTPDGLRLQLNEAEKDLLKAWNGVFSQPARAE